MLEDLIKIGITAPSGTNSQAWTFTVLPTRTAVNVPGSTGRCLFHEVKRYAEKSCFGCSSSSSAKAISTPTTTVITKGERGA